MRDCLRVLRRAVRRYKVMNWEGEVMLKVEMGACRVMIIERAAVVFV
jgi:hypothetical protein